MASMYLINVREKSNNGQFCKEQSHVPMLKKNYHYLSTLIDKSNEAILLIGQKGTGKETTAKSFYQLESNYRKIKKNTDNFYFKVINSDNAYKVINDIQINYTHFNNCFYIPKIESLDPSAQIALAEIIEHQNSLNQFFYNRFIFSTEESLELSILRKKVHKKLSQTLIPHQVNFPKLDKRLPDLLNIASRLFKKNNVSHKLLNTEFLNLAASHSFRNNIDSLDSWIQECAFLEDWSIDSLNKTIETHCVVNKEDNFNRSNQKHFISQALNNNFGQTSKTAKSLGLTKAQLLEKMLKVGARFQYGS